MKKIVALVLGSWTIHFVLAACSSEPTISRGPDYVAPSSPGTSQNGQDGAVQAKGPGQTTDPTSTASADSLSGSRIKNAYNVGVDGSKVFAYQVDTQRNNELCTWLVAADGIRRCLPATTAYVAGFADAQCITHLAINTCAPTGYVATFDGNTCATVSTHIFPLGQVYTGTTWLVSGVSCLAAGQASANTYLLGPEIDPGSFASGSLQVE